MACGSTKRSRPSSDVVGVAGRLCVGASLLGLLGCSGHAVDDAVQRSVDALAADARCPPGMVEVAGSGTIGIEPERFAVVQTAHLDAVQSPEDRCPAALAASPEALACWVQTDLVDPVLQPRPVTVDPVCVDAWPFPGPGLRYTTDGMTAWDAKVLQDVLARGDLGGRRLCTATELQAAVAGLDANLPFVYGSQLRPGLCPSDTDGIIGSSPDCRNPQTGLGEYGAVHSHWVVADEDFVAHACDAPPCKAAGNRPLKAGMFIVLGGTARAQTRQAPHTPHTWHDHGRPTPTGCDAMGHDDQVAICAEPSEGWGRHDAGLVREEAQWQALVEVVRRSGRADAFLDAATGGPSCPGPP